MTSSGMFKIAMIGVALGAPLLNAGELSSHRGMQFGMSLPAAAKQAGTNPAEARTVHQRPAVIQELDWQPRSSVLTDPVKQGLLCFYDRELFPMVVTSDRYELEGMTADDMIEAIPATYGVAAKPVAEIVYHSIYEKVAPVVARWEDPQYAYNLVRTGDRSSFAMVFYSKRLDALAQAAVVEAVRRREGSIGELAKRSALE